MPPSGREVALGGGGLVGTRDARGMFYDPTGKVEERAHRPSNSNDASRNELKKRKKELGHSLRILATVLRISPRG